MNSDTKKGIATWASLPFIWLTVWFVFEWFELGFLGAGFTNALIGFCVVGFILMICAYIITR